MYASKLTALFLLLLAASAFGQRFREAAALPAGYEIADIAAGPDGRIFAVGFFEPDDPSRPEEDQGDAFAAAFSPDAKELLYLKTWIGRRNDIAVSVAVDPMGAAYVAVRSSSANLVGTPGALQPDFLAASTQSFVAKLDPEGNVVYQTFLGGTSDTSVQAVSVRDTGEAVVTGQSYGEGFPTTPGAAIASEDSSAGFVIVLDAEGATALVSVRGVGGSAIAVDGDGNLYGGGSALGPGFVPITLGAFQPTHEQRACGGGIFGIPCSYGYVFGLSGDGTEILFATFLTGSHGSAISSVAVDAAGGILVAGSTNSEDFPALVASSKDSRPEPAVPVPPIIPPPSRGFVAKLNADGSELISSTILGGSGQDYLSDMLIGLDSLYVAGRAGSHDLPGLSAQSQCMPAGLVAELSLDGDVLRAATTDRLAQPSLTLSGDGLVVAGGNGVMTADLSEPAPRIACIKEAATQTSADAVAPGTLLSLFGQSLAPEPLVATPDADGFFPTSLGGITVVVGGRPAPLLYVSPDQINLQVPFETELGTAQITLDPPDAFDSPRALAVDARRPAVFLNPLQQDPCPSLYPFPWEITPTGSPLPLALNADGTVNCCQNPAQPGARATIFLTGIGATEPARRTGSVNSDPPTPLSLEVKLEPYVASASAVALSGSISSIWKVEFDIPHDAYGRLGLLPSVDGVKATPERIVLWVGPAR